MSIKLARAIILLQCVSNKVIHRIYSDAAPHLRHTSSSAPAAALPGQWGTGSGWQAAGEPQHTCTHVSVVDQHIHMIAP